MTILGLKQELLEFIKRKWIIPRFEAVFANPGNAFRLCGIDSEFAGTCVGLPSEPRIVTKPPNKKVIKKIWKFGFKP